MAELLTAESRSFEGPGALEWTVLTTCTLARSQAFAHDGVSSLAVTTTGASGGPQSPVVPATGIGTVPPKARIWVYDPAGGNFIVYGQPFTTPGVGIQIWSAPYAVPAGVWTELVVYVPPGYPYYRTWIRQNGGALRTWYVDDVSLNDNYIAPVVPPVYTHTLADVRLALAAALRNIVGLRVYDFPSDRVETPAAVLSMPETPYDVTLSGRSDEWSFPLWVLVARADDKSAYSEMYDYLEAEGPKSIRAMIEADRTLGGACDTAAVVSARPLFATVAGTEFLAVEFTLEVYT